MGGEVFKILCGKFYFSEFFGNFGAKNIPVSSFRANPALVI